MLTGGKHTRAGASCVTFKLDAFFPRYHARWKSIGILWIFIFFNGWLNHSDVIGGKYFLLIIKRRCISLGPCLEGTREKRRCILRKQGTRPGWLEQLLDQLKRMWRRNLFDERFSHLLFVTISDGEGKKNVLRSLEEGGGLNIYRAAALVGSSSARSQGWQEKRRIERREQRNPGRIGNEVGGDSIRWINATRENDDVDVLHKVLKRGGGGCRIMADSSAVFPSFPVFFPVRIRNIRLFWLWGSSFISRLLIRTYIAYPLRWEMKWNPVLLSSFSPFCCLLNASSLHLYVFAPGWGGESPPIPHCPWSSADIYAYRILASSLPGLCVENENVEWYL